MQIQLCKDLPSNNTRDGDWQYLTMDELHTIKAASCNDLRINNVLDYSNQPELVLSDILSKIRYDGTLHLNGVDLMAVCQQVAVGILNIYQAQELLYKDRLSTRTLETISQQIKQSGFVVKIATLDNSTYRYSIVAHRPKNETDNLN